MCVRILVPSVVALRDGVTLRGGAFWEVIGSLGILPSEVIKVVLLDSE